MCTIIYICIDTYCTSHSHRRYKVNTTCNSPSMYEKQLRSHDIP